MKKKVSRRKKAKKEDSQDEVFTLSVLLLFLIVVAVIFYVVNFVNPDQQNVEQHEQLLVAKVGSEPITQEDLQWWYELSIMPDKREEVSKTTFLRDSLIPQVVLVEEAKERGISISDDDVDKLLGLYLIENGLSINQFEQELAANDLTIEDVERSFETRAYILALLDDEDIQLANDALIVDKSNMQFQQFLDSVLAEQDIEVYIENINALSITAFQAINQPACDQKKVVVRLFTTSTCGLCEEATTQFDKVAKQYSPSEIVSFIHWQLDTGDNLITKTKEKTIPSFEVSVFKDHSPENTVPALVVGCSYKHIGPLSEEVTAELDAIVNQYELLGE